MRLPLVSTIVLSYNYSRFILETLDSVRDQTYAATQLIIVDDCSSDDSVATIDDWLRRSKIDCAFIRHSENQGVCKSLNDALDVARGEYISMVAADDVWLPDKTRLQVEIMESQPDDVAVVYSDAFQMDEGGHPLPAMFIEAHRKLPEIPEGMILDTLLQGNFIPAMTTLIRRSSYDKVGFYDEDLPWEDWDMWLRIAEHYSFIYSTKPSAKYRVHKNSLSHSDSQRMSKDLLRIGLKQWRRACLNEDQKAKLAGTLLSYAAGLYRENDAEAADSAYAIWKATGDKRAVWLYRCMESGLSYRVWFYANQFRIQLRQLWPRLNW
jgi:glycosyltransferase involved in cell wall biosynthesis